MTQAISWLRICKASYSGWWFQTFFTFHNIWDNPSHWLSYFSGWLKPPSSIHIYSSFFFASFACRIWVQFLALPDTLSNPSPHIARILWGDGFPPDVSRYLQPFSSHSPAISHLQPQVMMFSATLSPDTRDICKKFMQSRVLRRVLEQLKPLK